MPAISRFIGITIRMYYNEQGPAHFHARSGSQWASVAIHAIRVLEGRLSPRALGLVMEWAELHQDELIENWRLARSRQPLRRIRPLE